MKTKIPYNQPPTHKRRVELLRSSKSMSMLLLLSILLIFSTTSYAQVAPVNPPSGGFNINGGLKANTSVGDWVKGTGTGGFVLNDDGSAPNTATTGLQRDAYNSGSDFIFTTGSKFNDIIPNLQWTQSSAPNKNDINNAMYHVSQDPALNANGGHDQWIMIGGDRLSTSGTSYIDFEFLQNTLTRNPTGGHFTGGGPDGGRTIGDRIISMEYTNGGTAANVYFYTWKKSGSTYFWDSTGSSKVTAAFAVTNGANESVPFGAFGLTTYPPFAFVEAAINVTKLLQASGDACAGLSVKTLWIKTKASASSTAALKDFVEPISVSFNFGTAMIDYPGGPFCPVGTATVNQTGIIGGTYSASPAGLSINSTTGAINLGTSTPNTYTVTYTYNSGNGCIKTATAQVVIKTNPAAPSVGVVDNCNGTSTLTVTGIVNGATITWSDDATNHSNPRTVNTAGIYKVTQTLNGCTSPEGSGTASPKTTPAAPSVGVVDNCNGTSTLTVTGIVNGATITWSDDVTNHSNPRTVNTAGIYKVIQTLNGCTSPEGSGTASPKTTPAAPSVGVVDNCNGTSTLTVTGIVNGATITWSDDATNHSNPRTVNAAGTYKVTQTSNGCTSPEGSGTASPKTTPAAPSVGVVDNCDGTSTLTVTGIVNGATITWSDDATNHSNPRTVNAGGTYKVTQTVNGCTSPEGSGVAAPKITPAAPSVIYNAPACDQNTFSVTVSSVISGATYSIFDKNGNAIGGVSPSSPHVTSNNSDFNFSNIPAGSGYQVTVTNNGCSSSPNSCGSSSLAGPSSQQTLSSSAQSLKPSVLAAPNPFNDRIRFSFQSPVAGKGSLELYTLLGQKVATVFQGYVQKGQVQTVMYNVPASQRTNLIYVFRIGNQKVSSMLIGSK